MKVRVIMKSLLNNFCKYTVAMAVLVILCPETTWAGGRSKHKNSSNVIAAPNGNTGIAGTGLSQPGSKWLNHMQQGKKVIAAPNGNTGFAGSGILATGQQMAESHAESRIRRNKSARVVVHTDWNVKFGRLHIVEDQE
jgi:hypothetical protein